ncbi:phosphotransferase enzyme family protein [Aspergillus sclerotiicarbonarius CBS 121057]|uniref:Phosphotransferase enzyme family protein n=1 Tax=Aspergillus sclerotiicarbonarius (strain CBS 121057 / IBT 28362) TaxID=1448318 RepID=A0A319E5X5_ASPSB|nr:phosphotransferase enzyme family protein [Aspergillus sclerotiicarbonarius CBS 121057]
MASTVELPYYATDLPSPLPTEADIDAAPDISLAYGGRRVVKIGTHFVVKYGRGVNLIEGENMLYVQKSTSIPVPRVYALYSNPETRKNYIIMERIAGQTLLSLWPELNHSEKETVAATLQTYFDELRQLPSPGYYGSLGKRHLCDDIFWTNEPNPEINGPFTSHEAVIEAMALKYTYDGRSVFRADFYRQCLPRLLHSDGSIYTHGDFQRKNIMVPRNADSVSEPAGLRVVVIDWEKSGWYPCYWEYCYAVCALRWDDDWCLWLEKMLEPYAGESAWFKAIHLELWS